MLGQSSVTLSPDTLVAGLDGLFEQATALFAAARAQRRFTIAGTTFAVASDLADYLDIAARAIASDTPADQPDARLFVGVAGHRGCPMIHWCAPHFEERRIDAILAPTRYRMYHYQPLSYWQVYDRKTATGLQIMAGADEYPPWDPGSPLRNFLQWHLATCGGALVHAGTLGIDDKGVLLAGAGGSGKSGTVLSGMLAGLTTVGDDYVFLMQDTMRAYPLFETLKQDQGGLTRLGLLDHPAIPSDTNWQNKYQFFMADMGIAPRVEGISVRALLLPGISGQTKTTFSPVSAKEAFLALAPSGITQIPGDRPLLYATAAEIARRLPCYRLNLGSDPADISDTIRQFIRDI